MTSTEPCPGWIDSCLQRCGREVERKVVCVDGNRDDLEVDDRFCAVKTEKPASRCLCPQCSNWQEVRGDCSPADPNNPRCGSGAGTRTVTWTCPEGEHCDPAARPPDEAARPCDIPCDPNSWHAVAIGECKNDQPYEDWLCDVKNPREPIMWECKNPAGAWMCGPQPEETTRPCAMATCRPWIKEVSPGCYDASDRLMGCGPKEDGWHKLTYRCSEGNERLCNPMERNNMEQREPCTTDQLVSCMWVPGPWEVPAAAAAAARVGRPYYGKAQPGGVNHNPNSRSSNSSNNSSNSSNSNNSNNSNKSNNSNRWNKHPGSRSQATVPRCAPRTAANGRGCR